MPNAEKKYEETRGEGFWERRMKRTKELQKQYEKKVLKMRAIRKEEIENPLLSDFGMLKI